MPFFAGISLNTLVSTQTTEEKNKAVINKGKFALIGDGLLAAAVATIAVLALLSIQGMVHLGPLSGINAMGNKAAYALIGIAGAIPVLDLVLIFLHLIRFARQLNHPTNKPMTPTDLLQSELAKQKADLERQAVRILALINEKNTLQTALNEKDALLTAAQEDKGKGNTLKQQLERKNTKLKENLSEKERQIEGLVSEIEGVVATVAATSEKELTDLQSDYSKVVKMNERLTLENTEFRQRMELHGNSK